MASILEFVRIKQIFIFRIEPPCTVCVLFSEYAAGFFREYAAGYFGPNTVLGSVRYSWALTRRFILMNNSSTKPQNKLQKVLAQATRSCAFSRSSRLGPQLSTKLSKIRSP